MFARATIAALICALTATPAAAGDSLFTGMYAGGTAHYEDLTARVDSSGVNFATFDDEEMSYGGLIGWRAALNTRWVVGIEGFAQASGVDTDIVLINTFFDANLDTDTSFGGGVTLGRVFGENLLVFGSAGAAFTKFKNKQNGFTVETTKLWGWRAGAGIELALGPHLGVRAEATYTNYRNFDFLIINTLIGPTFVTMRPRILGFGGAVIFAF